MRKTYNLNFSHFMCSALLIMSPDSANCIQVAGMLRDAKADDVRVLDVRPRHCDFTDEMVVATARSKLHCQSLAQAIVYRARPFAIIKPPLQEHLSAG